MVRTLRSPWYLAPFAVLLAVTAVSVVIAQRSPTRAVAAPTATATAATPTATTTAADARRVADLASIAKVLETYRARNGTYPTTERYFTTVCQRAFDAGCLLTTITKDLPFTDGTNPYWYQSDGASYTLFAAADAAAATDTCPAGVPPALAGRPVLCLSSAGGGH